MDFGSLFNLNLLAPSSYQDSDSDRLREGWYPAQCISIVPTEIEIEFSFQLLVGEGRELQAYTDNDLTLDSQAWEWAEAILGRSLEEDEKIDLESLNGHSCLVEVSEELFGDPRCEVVDLHLSQHHIQMAQQMEQMLHHHDPLDMTPEKAAQQNEQLNRRLQKTRNRAKSSKRPPLSKRFNNLTKEK